GRPERQTAVTGGGFGGKQPGSGFRVEDRGSPVVGGHRQTGPVRAEGHRVTPAPERVLELEKRFAGGQLPEERLAAPACGGEPASIGTEGDGHDQGSMSFQYPFLRSRFHVPDADGLVAAGRGEPASVGAEGQAVNPLPGGK